MINILLIISCLSLLSISSCLISSSIRIFYYYFISINNPLSVPQLVLQKDPVLVLKNKYYISILDSISRAYLYTINAKPVSFILNDNLYYLTIYNKALELYMVDNTPDPQKQTPDKYSTHVKKHFTIDLSHDGSSIGYNLENLNTFINSTYNDKFIVLIDNKEIDITYFINSL